MTQEPHTPPEIIGYRRSTAIPGIEIVDARDSPREWRVFCTQLAIVVFHTWRGPVSFRGITHQGQPGSVFCNTPSELMVSRPDGDRPGSFHVIEFAPELLREWLAEQHGPTRRPEWTAAMQQISTELSASFSSFFDTFEFESSPLQLQSELVQLSESMVHELVRGMGDSRPAHEGPPLRGTARMRECLHEEGLDIDLETLARKVGLSRFQALRAFKRRYGLPPHAYQIAVRLGKARGMLNAGASAVDVAMHCGFVDQSHFNRHFKRTFGVTPMQYARGQAPSSGTFLVSRVLGGDLETLLERSDHSRT